MPEGDEDYWYEHRRELMQGQVFRTRDGSLVMLDRTVPGDATKWYVADWSNGWFYYDSTIEPGELTGMPLDRPARIPTTRTEEPCTIAPTAATTRRRFPA